MPPLPAIKNDALGTPHKPAAQPRDPNRVTYFAETDNRGKRIPFGIRSDDRSRHTYIIGKTGMGKSTVLENMAIQDIAAGEGLAFIDPHGKTADLLLEYVPPERVKDVLYFAPFDMDFPVAFNVMEDVGYDKRHLVVSGLMSAFKKIWVDAWSARMEYILNNTLLALLEYPGATIISVNRMFSDKDYRKKVVENVSDPSVKSFWQDEFAKYNERYAQESTAAIQNKIGQFISNPLVRNIIGQPKSTFDLRKMMDERKILIVNLSKGRVGEMNANLLGSMLITKLYLAAMSRADKSNTVQTSLPNFYLYVDEFQSFANESFAGILSEARKYKLNLTMAHQYIEQMSEEVRAAVFGNVGSMIVFRVGAYDAEVLEKEFFPTFTKEDLVNLGFVQIYLKLMIDGVTSQPFSARTLPPIEKQAVSFKEDIVDNSRKVFSQPRDVVETAIRDWHAPVLSGRPPAAGQLPRSVAGLAGQHTTVTAPAAAVKIASTVTTAISGTVVTNKVVTIEKEKTSPAPASRPVAGPFQPSQSHQSQQPQPRQEFSKPPRDAVIIPKDPKTPTPQNKNALRDALAAVMKNPPAKEPVQRSSVSAQTAAQQKPVESPKSSAPNVQHAAMPSEPPEVPESVLRSILDVNE